MKTPKFQVFTGQDGQFYFRPRDSGGEIILANEGYTSKAGCQNGIRSVKENAPLDERYRRRTSANDQCHFVLVAANGEVIGVSETYTTERRRDEGIEAVKRIAPDAPVEDTTPLDEKTQEGFPNRP